MSDGSRDRIQEPGQLSEHPNTLHRDWRLQAITVLTEPLWSGTTLYPVGTPVELAGPVRFDGKCVHIMPPNAAALFLSHSWRSRGVAVALLAELRPEFKADTKIDGAIEGRVFDAVENLVATVVFAFSAVEAFANEMIPDEYVYRTQRVDGRCTEEYDKGQVERSVALDTKLTEILPKIMRSTNPKGSETWQRYVALKRLRDRIVHLKSTDRYPKGGSDAESWVWRTLLEPWVLDAPSVARTLIDNYWPGGTRKPRWLHHCPVPPLSR
jgi:hypothetical protein